MWNNTVSNDDYDISKSSGSNRLVSLFGENFDNGSESLAYTPPKLPQKIRASSQSQSQKSSSTPSGSVLIASPVTAYKEKGGQYQTVGKLGVAIIGNVSKRDFKVLLYVTREQQVTHVQLTSTFQLVISRQRYASFYDINQQSWLLLFESDSSLVEFARHVCIARFLSSDGNSLISMDLVVGEGSVLAVGDSAELRYTGWLLQGAAPGSVFDSNVVAEESMIKPLRVRLGAGKMLQGWEQGLPGMAKGGHRLLLLPAQLAYGDKSFGGGKVPPNSPLLFEIELLRLRTTTANAPVPMPRDRQNSNISVQSVSAELPLPFLPAESESEEDSNFKDRANSVSDKLGDVDTTSSAGGKSDILSRMAKMGKSVFANSTLPLPNSIQAPVVPLQGQNAEVYAEEDSQQATPSASISVPPHVVRQPKPTRPITELKQPFHQPPPPMQTDYHLPQTQMETLMPPPFSSYQQQTFDYQQTPLAQFPAYSAPFGNATMNQQLAVYQSQARPHQSTIQQQFPLPQVQMFAAPAQTLAASAVEPRSSGDLHSAMLVNETRQQNTEVRVVLSKLGDKLDRVLQLVDNGGVNSSNSHSLMPMMENGQLLANLQRIIGDNERLKHDSMEKAEHIEKQNAKISELLQHNQSVMEKSNILLEQRGATLSSTAAESVNRVLGLEEEKLHLARQLGERTAEQAQLELQLVRLRTSELELRNKLTSVMDASNTTQDEVVRLRARAQDAELRAESLANFLRDEKTCRAALDEKLRSVTEQVNELTTRRIELEREVDDRRRRQQADRESAERELAASRRLAEQEMESLRERLREERNSLDTARSTHSNALEEQLTAQWREKSALLVAQERERCERRYLDLEEEKKREVDRVDELRKKIVSLRAAAHEQELSAQREREQLEDVQNKYSTLREHAVAMKSRLLNLVNERNELQVRNAQLEKDADEAAARVEAAAVLSATSKISPAVSQVDVAAEVKKVMNSVFQTLRNEIDANLSYQGSVVVAMLLRVIKSTTLAMISSSNPSDEAVDDDDDGDDDEEDEEEEEEIETPSVENKLYMMGVVSNETNPPTSSRNVLEKKTFDNDQETVYFSPTFDTSEDSPLSFVFPVQVENPRDSSVSSEVVVGLNQQQAASGNRLQFVDNVKITQVSSSASAQSDDDGDYEEVAAPPPELLPQSLRLSSSTATTITQTSLENESMASAELKNEETVALEADTVLPTSSKEEMVTSDSTTLPPTLSQEKTVASESTTVLPISSQEETVASESTTVLPISSQEETVASESTTLPPTSSQEETVASESTTLPENTTTSLRETVSSKVKSGASGSNNKADVEIDRLFGSEDDDDDFINVISRPKKKADDDFKPTPPPLFNDDNELDDELDWLK